MSRSTHDRHWHPVFGACSAGILITEGATVLRANDGCAELLGAETPESIVGAPIGEWLATTEADSPLETAIADLDVDERWDAMLKPRQATDQGGSLTGTAIRLDGETVGWVLTAEDRTEGDRSDETPSPDAGHSRPSTARSYRALVENFPNGAVALFDTDLRYTIVEGAIFEDLDIDAADMEGTALTEVHTPAFQDRYVHHFRAALAGEQRTFDFSFGDRVFQAHVLPVRDDEGRVASGLSMTQDITAQREEQRELERRRDELATLTRVNELVLETTRELIESSSREAVYRTVCERLGGSELYEFAWVGERTLDDDRIEVRARAGDDDGYLEDITIRADETALGQGPGGTVLRTGDVQVTNVDAPAFEPWREQARTRGLESVAAVPLQHGDTIYGVLAVYATRSDAFSRREQTAFAVLGETIGFVVTAIHHRDILLADRGVELEFRICADDCVPVALSERVHGQVTLAGQVFRDDRWHFYCDVSDATPAAVTSAIETVADIEDSQLLGEWDGSTRVELVSAHVPLLERIDDAGGTVKSMVAERGTGRVVVELPQSTDVRESVERIRSAYPDAELLARHDIDRAPSHSDLPRELLDRLTDRQREALEAAYRSGYFQWPRNRSAEDVATALGVSRPTFQAHLRKAQYQVYETLFD